MRTTELTTEYTCAKDFVEDQTAGPAAYEDWCKEYYDDRDVTNENITKLKVEGMKLWGKTIFTRTTSTSEEYYSIFTGYFAA